MKHYCEGTHVTPGSPALFFHYSHSSTPSYRC